MELTEAEIKRYSKHIVLPEISIKGQQKIKNAKVLVVGAGGLGSPAMLYLAAAGIGTVGIADFDTVEENNLQRQIIHTIDFVGKPKTESAKKAIESINPSVNVVLHNEKLTSENAAEIIKNYDVVIDGSDNFFTKYIVNDACVLLKKPNVYGSILGFEGQVSVFNYENCPCYRCMLPSSPEKLIPNCAEAGVLGVLPGVMGTIQATEALKIIVGVGDILSGRLLIYDALEMKFKEFKLNKNKNCLVCNGSNAENKIEINSNKNNRITNEEVTVHELKSMIDDNKDFELIDVRIKGGISGLDNTDKNKKIILYCDTGNRSFLAAQILKNKGFKNVKNLIGGINAWAEEIDNK